MSNTRLSSRWHALIGAGIGLAVSWMGGIGMSAENEDSVVLGGGCFWCIEAVFETQEGVLDVVSGYAGGTVPHPSYDQVCTGQTGHAEVVLIRFDRTKTSLERLLDLFWKAHDPTTLNRQGADIGTTYRSILLYRGEDQRAIAEASRQAASPLFSRPIVTQIEKLAAFYPAEPEHQDYFRRHPDRSYCKIVIAPKLRHLTEQTSP